MSLKISPITPTIGAEIRDLDLAEPFSPKTLAEVQAAFTKHHVLVFRNQTLSRAQHKQFALQFGGLHIHPSKLNGLNQDDAETFIINIKPSATQSNGEPWHSDVSCASIPPFASILYITEIPENEGGDTQFMNMHAAFDSLSTNLQTLLLDKTAFHDGEHDLKHYGIKLEPGQEYPAHSHPMIIAHPITGRATLFVNPGFTTHIEDIPQWESKMLLDGLFAYTASNPRLQCRVKWTPGTVTMWDNFSVQHQAIFDYSGCSRYGERMTVKWDQGPVAYQA
ncbi:MAG: taurine dioxygenase [Gammaproteobacteria bacterium]|jgi:taurine dioxygenase|nr:taurine dioxygenase [Gammaproteobacteria bacterium]MBT5203271.1 taurine dioxygenase [Gammaproteobacteria bacterium]MBT6244374.1 taurine dioxygenase [Gammaproteobacteria bacterium]